MTLSSSPFLSVSDPMNDPVLTAPPGLLADHQIAHLAQTQDMISPFSPEQVRMVAGQKIISYGLSSYGYDARCANEFMIFTNVDNAVVDPKAFSSQSFVERTTDVCVIPPNSIV